MSIVVYVCIALGEKLAQFKETEARSISVLIDTKVNHLNNTSYLCSLRHIASLNFTYTTLYITLTYDSIRSKHERWAPPTTVTSRCEDVKRFATWPKLE